MIRFLRADEIETRVASTTKDNKRCNVLLYKTARTDYDLLDEIFGADNWQNDYREIKGVMYCGIAVKNAKGEWVWKWNAGVESQGQGEDDTNNQKGEASDSFKRAGFCWGIGRELYKWKDIWVDLVDGDIGQNGKTKARFEVKEISYDDKGEPAHLVLVDRNGNKRYETGKKVIVPQSPKQTDTTISTPTPNIPTPEPQKSVSKPETAQKTVSALSSVELNTAREQVKAQNLPIKKKMLLFALNILKDQFPEEIVTKEAQEAVRSYLADKLHLKLETIEMVEVIGRNPNVDDTLPKIQGNIPLIIDDLFWHGNDKIQGFEQFVKDRLPFPNVEREE